MYKEEYQQWRADALFALAARYSYEDAKKVVEWFDNIKASHERDLVGEDVLQCLMYIAKRDKHWNLYNNMMMRMWLYAPYIIAEGK